jgi:hypothetical protein
MIDGFARFLWLSVQLAEHGRSLEDFARNCDPNAVLLMCGDSAIKQNLTISLV